MVGGVFCAHSTDLYIRYRISLSVMDDYSCTRLRNPSAVHRCQVLHWVSAQRRGWDLQPPTIMFGISNQQSDVLNRVRK